MGRECVHRREFGADEDGEEQGATSPVVGPSPSKKDPLGSQPTLLEKLLEGAGPAREDGGDKYFGMENVGCRYQLISSSALADGE